jgi:hypothetical protein
MWGGTSGVALRELPMKADGRTLRDLACYYRGRLIGRLYVGRDGFLRYKPRSKT